MRLVRRFALASLSLGCTLAYADNTYHVLANGSLDQDWTNPALITVANDWSTATSFEGYRSGDALPGTANDPRTILDFAGATLHIAPDVTSLSPYTAAGLIDAAITDPVIALQGTNGNDITFLMLHLDTTGCTGVQLAYRLRDLDADPAVQPFVVQSRLGSVGNFAEVSGTYIANANIEADSPFNVSLPVGLENQAQVQLRWITNNVPGNDTIIGIDDIEVTGTCTGGVDNPPMVNNVVPSPNATGVLPGANLSVQFSEAVSTPDPGWYTLTCNGQNVPYTPGGSGSSRTINPNADLPFGASCAVAITGSLVTDLDLPIDPVASNTNYTFTVLVDNPPTVSTIPSAGQTGVSPSTNLQLNFSEPVTTIGSWYGLTCNSVPVPVTPSGTGATRTLNPDDNLPLSTNCLLTLTNSLITDTDGTPDPLAGSNFTLAFTTGAGASGYYAPVDASTAVSLRSTLHNLIDDHTVFPYTDNDPGDIDVWKMVEQAEEDPTEPTKVLDIYRNRKYNKVTDRNMGITGATNYNREHSWPNSLGFGLSDSQGQDDQGRIVAPYTDGHMLFASVSDYNNFRGNKPFNNCPSGCTENPTDANHGAGGGTGVYPGQSNWNGGSVYEVWAGRKGDLARAILYMDVRYEGGTSPNGADEPNLIVTNNAALIQGTGSGVVAKEAFMGILSTLLTWHAADPPDAKECYRNEVIFSHQGNRNPFIDHPEFATCLWGASCTGIQSSACAVGEPDALFDDGFEN